MAVDVCVVDGCEKPVKVKSRGWCGMHYARWQRGQPLDAPERVAVRHTGQPCSVDDCDTVASTKGLCRHHYYRTLQGQPLTGGRRPQPRAPWQVRIWRFIEFGGPVRPGVDSSCWQWISSISSRTGYASIGIGAAAKGGPKTRTGHRAMWQLVNGPIPDGPWLDHRCRNRACVNPHHLRLVTPMANTVHNSGSDAAYLSRQTHCKRGHEFTVENTYYDRGKPYRQCRECRRIRDRQRVRRPR